MAWTIGWIIGAWEVVRLRGCYGVLIFLRCDGFIFFLAGFGGCLPRRAPLGSRGCVGILICELRDARARSHFIVLSSYHI